MIDLSELVPSLEAALTVPGAEAEFATVPEDQWVIRLVNAFWNAFNAGLFTGYSVDEDGAVTPTEGTEDMGRDMQQVLVLYAAMDVVRNQMRQLNTVFRAKAGPVEYETQQSATLLKALLDGYMGQIADLVERMGDTGGTTASFYLDGVFGREQAINYGLTYWVK